MDDLPPGLGEASGRGGACSLQWAEPGSAGLVGDAAFAPDILAAQGLARGLTQGLAAACGASAHGGALVDSLSAHIAALREAISLCRWCSEPAWRRYEQHLASASLPLATEAT